MTVSHGHVQRATPLIEATPCACSHGELRPGGTDGRLRPRFTCGQLLTDDDLTTMVAWTAGKSRLNRFRTGWGVACGLQVRCDPSNPLGVIVGEGYALDCCGDDIVLCEEQPLDLTSAGGRDDPCAQPALSHEAVAQERRRAREEVNRTIGQRQAQTGGSTSGAVGAIRERLTTVGPVSSPRPSKPPPWVDVYVAYTEQDADLRATLNHSDCAEAPECSAAKTREWFTLSWRAGGAADPADDATAAWCRGYEDSLHVLRRYVTEFGSGGTDWATQRTWLKTWMHGHRPHVFCDLDETVAGWSDEVLAARHTEVLIKLVLEHREVYTRRTSPTCENGREVRLARVYLGQVGDGSPVRVVRIDNHPPFRRTLSLAGPPAPVGAANVAELVGERWPEACRRLAAVGVAAQPRDLPVGAGAADLLAALDCGCGPVVECGGAVTVLLVEFPGDPLQGKRVIGFCDEGDLVDGGDLPPTPPVIAGGDSGAGVGTPQARDADAAMPEEERRREMDRIKEVNGIGDAIAARLVDAQLTLEVLATVPDEQREDLVARVEGVLPALSRSRARQWVEEARALWQAHAADTGDA